MSRAEGERRLGHMLVRSLYAVIVALGVIAGVEIGFLRWGSEKTQDAGNRGQGTGDRERVPTAPVPGPPCPVPGVLSSEDPEPVVAQVPRPEPVRRRKKATSEEPSAAALAACAREGGPLCEMPVR